MATTKGNSKKKKEHGPQIIEAKPFTAWPLEQTIATCSTSSSSSSSRRNVNSTSPILDQYKNIDDGIIPYVETGSNRKNNSCISVKDAILLCQKCYYNFAIFRNVIDLMTEFSWGQILWKKGTTKAKKWFSAYFASIGLDGIQDRFYREFFRSGNVFIYKFVGKLEKGDIQRMATVYGEEEFTNLTTPKSVTIPLKYIILNPTEITISNRISFLESEYHKMLSPFEVAVLKDPQTEEEKKILNSLPPDAKASIKKGNTSIKLPLTRQFMDVIFYKKQDYEPLAVPMGFPVLQDINFKAEMKKMDALIHRTVQQAILLITMGDTPDKGGVNQKNIDAVRVFFETESISRVLVADYTTKAEFIVPQISELLDPKKYEVIDRDISLGLNNILSTGEKFGNQSVKVEIFIERLKQARLAFINEWLMPQIKEISKQLGLKTYPTPYYEDINLKDELEYAKIYTRLMELGLLTPEEGFDAINTGQLPSTEESIESQKAYKKNKDAGLYEPLLNKPKEEAGRPGGTKAPKKQARPGVVRGHFNFATLRSVITDSEELLKSIVSTLKADYGVKKLDKKQNKIANDISELIIANESPDKWVESIKSYISDPKDKNKKQVSDILDLAEEHSVNPYQASLLFHARIEPKEEECLETE